MNNKHYDYVLFDLDGTLTDSGPGVMNGFEYAIGKMGRDVPPREQLARFVGPPLTESFGTILGYSPEDTKTAIDHYRVYYNELGGVKENSVYPGVTKLLADVRAMGKMLCIATSKSEKGTEFVLDYFDLAKYFDHVANANDKDRVHKIDVLRYAIEICGVDDLGKVVIVGDRKYDVEAANEVGIDSIGVLWGYGDEAELTAAGATYIAPTPEDVIRYL